MIDIYKIFDPNNLLGEVFIAVSTAIIIIGYKKFNEFYRLRVLRNVFGRSVSKSKDIIISVPLWRAIDNPSRTPRFLKQDFNEFKEELYGPNDMYNREDMTAAAYIVNFIGSQFSDQATYVNDFQNLEWSNKTVIMIGSPVANFHAKLLYTRLGREYTDFIPKFDIIDEDENTGARCTIFDPSIGRHRSSDSIYDFGAIICINNLFSYGESHSNKIFLMGGIHAESTREAARIFRNNWQMFSDNSSLYSYAIFSMSRNVVGSGKIISKENIK